MSTTPAAKITTARLTAGTTVRVHRNRYTDHLAPARNMLEADIELTVASVEACGDPRAKLVTFTTGETATAAPAAKWLVVEG